MNEIKLNCLNCKKEMKARYPRRCSDCHEKHIQELGFHPISQEQRNEAVLYFDLLLKD